MLRAVDAVRVPARLSLGILGSINVVMVAPQFYHKAHEYEASLTLLGWIAGLDLHYSPLKASHVTRNGAPEFKIAFREAGMSRENMEVIRGMYESFSRGMLRRRLDKCTRTSNEGRRRTSSTPTVILMSARRRCSKGYS
jgi:hypothetical protein